MEANLGGRIRGSQSVLAEASSQDPGVPGRDPRTPGPQNRRPGLPLALGTGLHKSRLRE